MCRVFGSSAFPGQFKSRMRVVRRATGRRGGPVAFERRSGKTGWKAEQSERLDHAVNALRRSRPELSAAEPMWFWQKITAAGLAALVFAAAILVPTAALPALLIVLAPPFLCVTLLRSLALWNVAAPRRKPGAPPHLREADGPLPTYSVLVPLFREAAIVPDLVAALAALDYPRDRLEILLILENVDHTTQAAVRSTELPAHMSVLVVPDGEPRTKPRALNYALTFATGDYVVVYDAEDLPEPGQLRLAVAALTSTPRLGCVQARLNIYNSDETWLTRQFTIEYTALFDCLLPTLERLRLPVPLGGTSNHFPRALLDEVGAWDPFNVTEDADLGIRLARRGWLVGVLDSTTWEEAPETFRSWLSQRTRWLKGWMQTYLVHARQPLRAARELGFVRFAGMHILMGGLILSALVHPWFYALLAADGIFGILSAADYALPPVFWWIGIFNLVSGYVTGVGLGCVAVIRRRRWRLAASALLMPLYWLLISVAAYRALAQLVTAPYRWEKTEHKARTPASPTNLAAVTSDLPRTPIAGATAQPDRPAAGAVIRKLELPIDRGRKNVPRGCRAGSAA